MAAAAPSQEQQDIEASQPLIPSSDPIKELSIDFRKGFVGKVYGILCVQLLLTVAIAAPIATQSVVWVQSHAWIMYASLAGMIACMCVMLCCAPVLRKYPQNYIFLFVFTCIMSVMVGFTSAMYTWQSVLLAAGATVLIFLLLSCYAWFTTTDFTGFGPYLFAALSVLMVFGMLIMIMSYCGIVVQWMMMVYDILGVLLFSFYIVYDTQLMLGDWGGHKLQFSLDDYCFAALTLYLDIINMFLFLLSMLGGRKN